MVTFILKPDYHILDMTEKIEKLFTVCPNEKCLYKSFSGTLISAVLVTRHTYKCKRAV